MVKPAIALIVSAALAACAAGPDYVRPTMATPERFAEASATDAQAFAVDDDGFWQQFGDPLLSQLIDDALAGNPDLRIALARWDRARALLGQSRLDHWPTVTAAGTATSGRSSGDQLPGVDRDARDADRFDAGIAAFWELDFVGRIRRQVQAQSASSDAAGEDVRTMQVALVAELATSYLRLRGLQERLRVAHGNADNQLESLRVVDARLDAGQGTEFDTSRARAQLASTLARIPELESAIAIDMHRIAVLTGRAPEVLRDELSEARAVPALSDAIDPGTPADLLRRRPDIAAAERRLAEATARIGVASADLFPRITLGGAFGTQALDVDDLFDRDSETRLLSLGIDWSFLDVGRVRARIAAAQAGADEQLASYQRTVLRAFEDTENALIVHRNRHRETRHLAEAAAAGARATDLARVQFDGGLVEFLQVLDAERIQLDAEDRLAQSQADTAVALIDLYRALAGGWPDRLPAQPRALAIAVDP